MDDRAPDSQRPTLLERLDLALVGQIAERVVGENTGPEEVAQGVGFRASDDDRRSWISGLLALRGFRVGRDDVARILSASSGRFRPEHQEFKLVAGFAEALESLEERSGAGRTPDGWWLVESFRRVTSRIERFRGNVLRRDQPWDALVRVTYPPAGELGPLLDAFHEDQAFGEDQAAFREMHPVRQGLRAMWRFARIAPFSDFNLPFAALAFGGYLLAKGYPPLLPQSGDRVRLERLVRGSLPIRSLGLEGRLLEQVQHARSGRT